MSRSGLPGKSSPSTTVALTKVALRMLGVADLADAIGDLTGLGQTRIESLVRTAEKEFSRHLTSEFTAVAPADREWAEGVLLRAYVGLAADPRRRIMGESIIGAPAVARLANDAMSDTDRRDVDAASDDVRAYLTALSESIAYLVSEWYSTDEEPNRAAVSQAVGETLDAVRGIPELLEDLRSHLDSTLAPVLVRLEDRGAERSSMQDGPASAHEPERLVFALQYDLTPMVTDSEFSDLVSRAVIATVEGRRVDVEVSLPTLEADLSVVDDTVIAAQLKRDRLNRARKIGLVLSAYFSPQVEAYWAHYFTELPERVAVARALLAEQSAKGSKLDVWRTTPPLASAPIWLTPDEVPAVLERVQLATMDHLRMGPGWRAADELPHSLIIEKVMPSILAEVVRTVETSDEGWPGEVLFLPHWHIGQG